MTITHKCDSIEKQTKELLFLNAALQSQIEETKVNIGIAKAERKFLLNKLLFYEKELPNEVFNNPTGGEITSSASNNGGASKILQQALSRKQSLGKKPLSSYQSTTFTDSQI